MKRFTIYFLLTFFSQIAFSQSLGKNHYWIPLADKDSNNYSIFDPAEFLSARAIERRLKQNIPITEDDLPPSEVYIDSLAGMGLEIRGLSRWFNAAIVRTSDTLLLESVSDLDFVVDFNPREVIFSSLVTANETDISNQEYREDNFVLNYGRSETQTYILNGKSLHDLGYRGEGMHIAVLDAGYYNADSLAAFKSLFESDRLLGTKDFVDGSSDIFRQSSHGTAVLSTMATDLPGIMIGTAPEASYWLLRSEDAGTEYRIEEAYWLLAAEFADSVGADVINSSLGYSNFYDPAMNYSHDDLTGEFALVTLAAERAFSKGILVVSSAGNEGNSEWQLITPPSDGENVLAVGAIDTSGVIAPFSSLGPTFDGRTKPDVVAVGSRTIIMNSAGNPVPGYGTSFASPQIAGMAACLWQAVPEKTNIEILQAIRNSANRSNNPDEYFGFGIPNFMIALWGLKSENHDVKRKMIAYPNPFNTKLQLDFIESGTGVRQIQVFNSEGKLVYSIRGNWMKNDFVDLNELERLEPGIYFLVARTDDSDMITKIIRQH